MYKSYWNLQRPPFAAAADPGFYYPSETHQGAVLKLRYAVENRRGGAVLAGPSGSGKTLLVNLLVTQLAETYSPLIHVVFPWLTPGELMAYLAAATGATRADGPAPPLHVSIDRLQTTLRENTRQGRHAVVAIDEAHLLDDPDALECLRLLLNFETDGQPDLTLLLVGQTGLLPILDRFPQLEERMGVKCLLRPLSAEETAAYVNHRLTVAGAEREIFGPEAIDTVFRSSHGLARRINRLADLALLIGYAEEQNSIGSAQVDAVAQELSVVVPE